MCRSRRELSNAYLLSKFGFDTAENEPCKVSPIERSATSAPGSTNAEDRVALCLVHLYLGHALLHDESLGLGAYYQRCLKDFGSFDTIVARAVLMPPGGV